MATTPSASRKIQRSGCDGWEDMLLPEGPEGTQRQQKQGKEVVFRADAAFAKPGSTKQWTQEGKQAVKMTRLSCHRSRRVLVVIPGSDFAQPKPVHNHHAKLSHKPDLNRWECVLAFGAIHLDSGILRLVSVKQPQ